MTARALFPADTLSLEQRRQVEALSGSVTPEQARWISGYFAGLEAGIARLAGDGALAGRRRGRGPDPDRPSRRRDRQFAPGSPRPSPPRRADQGLVAQVEDMARYKPRRLKEEQDLLVIVSTHGEGDPPQPALDFFEYVEGPKAPKLPELRYLGPRARRFHLRALSARPAGGSTGGFEALGATRLADRGRIATSIMTRRRHSGAPRRWPCLPPRPGRAARCPPRLTPPSRRRPRTTSAIPFQAPDHRQHHRSSAAIRPRRPATSSSTSPARASPTSPATRSASSPATIPPWSPRCSTRPASPATAPLTVKGETTTLAEALESHFEIAITPPRFLDHWAGLTGAAELRAAERGRRQGRAPGLASRPPHRRHRPAIPAEGCRCRDLRRRA